MPDEAEDAKTFGRDTFVYCRQHLNPHSTGWCTVDVSDKVGLGVTTYEEAREKCQDWGFKLFRG